MNACNIQMQYSAEEFEDLILNKTFEALRIAQRDHGDLLGEKILTLEAAAELLDVTTVTIHNWKKKGLLKPYWIGKRVYFLYSEILASLKVDDPEE